MKKILLSFVVYVAIALILTPALMIFNENENFWINFSGLLYIAALITIIRIYVKKRTR